MNSNHIQKIMLKFKVESLDKKKQNLQHRNYLTFFFCICNVVCTVFITVI